jgi:hypothetical protein
MGYLSALRGLSMSSGNIFLSSLNLLDPFTNAVNFVTVSSGSLLINGVFVGGGGGGGGGGAVAQIVAGTNISVTPAGGTGIVTVNNTGPNQTDINNSLSSFSTALGGNFYNFSTVSTSYASSFVTAFLQASTMTTVNILPSQSNLWVAVGFGSTAPNSIQFSGDAVTWSNSTAGGFSLSGKGVAYNGFLWVAVGNNGGASGSIQVSTDGRSWVNATSGGFSSGGNGVAYNGARWIAVGNNGGSALTSIQTSTDGRTWSGITAGGFSVVGESIAWNGSYWVAVGQGASTAASIQYSVDGQTWVSATTGGFSAGGRGIAYNGVYWVAVGDDITRAASIQYSGDGRNWSNVITGGFVSAGNKIAWNGRLWIAVGDDNVTAKSIQYSMDGSNWSDLNTGGFSGDGYGIAWNGVYWVATGGAGTAVASIQTSRDGSNWSSATSGGFASGGIGVGFSSNLRPAYSQQGLTILSQNIPLYLNSTNQIFAQPSSLVLNSALVIDGQWKRVGVNCNTPTVELDVGGTGRFQTLSTQAVNISSINGANYVSILPSTVRGLGQIYISAPTTSTVQLSVGQLFVSSLTANNLSSLSLSISSINGLPFGLPGYPSTVSTNYATSFGTSSLTASSINFVNLAQTNTNLWVSVGVDGTQAVKYSYDGITWSNAAGSQVFANNQGYGVAWNGRMWVAVGADGTQAVKYSSDGITWSNVVGSQVFGNNAGYGIAWNGRLWVAVGGDSTQAVKYSSDGITWSNAAGSQVFGANVGYGIAWNGRMWVAVGWDSTQAVKYSYDGINWSNAAGSQVFANNQGYGVAWNGRMWVVVGADTTQPVKYSTDGINWSSAAGSKVFGNNAGYGIAWNGRLWVAVGEDSTQSVKYSFDGITWSNAAGSQVFSFNIGYGVAWNGRVWVAGGGGPTQTNTIKYSTDGINWSNSSGSGTGFSSSGRGVAYSANVVPSYNQTNFEIEPQNIPIFLRSTNTMSFLQSTIIANNTLFVDATNKVGINTGAPQTDLDVGGIGRFLTVSTLNLNLSTINGQVFGAPINSTVIGLGSAGYVSTSQLVSTTAGLQSPITSTVIGLGSAGYVSTSQLVSTTAGLGTLGYISTSQLVSTTAGLGTLGYISTSQLVSTTAGLGTLGYFSTPPLRLSTNALFTSSLTASTITTPQFVTTQNALSIQYPRTDPSTTFFFAASTGVIGVGTSSPTSVLDVRDWTDPSYTGSVLALQAGFPAARGPVTTYFYYTGSQTTYTVSPYVTRIEIHMWGGGGGAGSNGGVASLGGGGAYVTGSMDVTPGQQFTLRVAGGGGRPFGGFGGGGNGNVGGGGGGGGGASWFIRTAGNTTLAVAAGGGGGGAFATTNIGGGGTWSGVGFRAGTVPQTQTTTPGTAQGGGGDTNNVSPAANGATGLWPGSNGTAGQGGAGNQSSGAPGGGGGGWVGGGGGGLDGSSVHGGGGGGSSYLFGFITTSGENASGSTSGGSNAIRTASTNPSAGTATITGGSNGLIAIIEQRVDPKPNRLLNLVGPTRSTLSFFTSDGSLALNTSTIRSGVTLDVSGIAQIRNLSAQSLTVSSLNGSPYFPGSSLTVSTGFLYASSIDVARLGRFQIVSTLALNISSINGTIYSAGGGGSGNGSSLTVSTGSLYASSMSFVNVAPSSSNVWVAVGNDSPTNANTIKYSLDGSNWSNASGTLFTSGEGRGVAWNGRIWVAVGNPGITASIKNSFDGITWVNATTNIFGSTGYGVAWNGRIWVAVGVGSPAAETIKYSLNGTAWINTSGGFSESGRGVAWNGRMWVAVGVASSAGSPNTTIKYSYNGINWSDSASGGFPQYGYGVAWNGRLWVAVGTGSSATDSIKFSSDGINWSNSVSGGFASVVGYGVAWNGRMWVAVGEGTLIKYSFDGLNWSNSSGFSGRGECISWNGSLWVAGGFDTTQNNTMKYSSDGIVWLNSSGTGFTQNAYGVAYSSNVTPGYAQANFEIESQNIPNFLTSTNQVSFLASTIILNNTLLVDINGRVGINTGIPQTELDVVGAGRFLSLSTFQFAASTVTSAVVNTTSLNTVSSITFGSGVGWITAGAIQAVAFSSIQMNSATAYISSLYCGSTTTILPGYTAWMNGPTRINQLLIGQASTVTQQPSFDLHLINNSAVKPLTTTWTAGSDLRVKENIVDADTEICYSNVKAIRLRRFAWQSSFFDSASGYDRHVLGFVAQEIATVVPKAVETKEAYGYSNFHFLNIDQLNMALFGAVKKTIQDKEVLESTLKGQHIEIQTLNETTTYIVSTLKGLQNQ